MKPKVRPIKLIKKENGYRIYICEGDFTFIGFKGQDIVLLTGRAEKELKW